MDYGPIMFNVRIADKMWPAKAFSLARKAHVYSASLFDKKNTLDRTNFETWI
jgi:hypothetical protein